MRLQTPAEPRDRWNSPIADYDILTTEVCKVLFEESKKYLEETIEESEEITNKAMRMLFLFLPAIAAVIGFIIIHKENFSRIDDLNIFLIIGLSVCAFCIILDLFNLMSPKYMHYRGAKPVDMMRQEIFQLRNPLQVEKAIYVSEIERIQIKIEQMEY